MKKYSIILISGLVLIMTSLWNCTPKKQKDEKKLPPNVLLIAVDDNNAWIDCMSCQDKFWPGKLCHHL